eukprot:TRINITY_DN1181_c0_g10_i1.p1 TRINITY_DN1181_c0_g10~~TRINITY_DN1181_c0_g10_i1.p1  ORF type:complete len:249 (+),score=53.13 TRINITY_DN1181_c0_g10_i1:1252-1998(+)
MKFAIYSKQAQELLGITPNATWMDIESNIYIPMNESEDIHLSWQNYNGSFGGMEVIMLGWPIQFPMNESTRKNDILYYTDRAYYVYAPRSMVMSMLAIAWSELQEWEQVENFTNIANEDHHPPFYVLNELPVSVGGGCNNFITGAGSLLQVLLNGYAGMRMNDTSLSLNPMLPANATWVTLSKFHYYGATFDFAWNATTIIFGSASIRSTLEGFEIYSEATELRYKMTTASEPLYLPLSKTYITPILI